MYAVLRELFQEKIFPISLRIAMFRQVMIWAEGVCLAGDGGVGGVISIFLTEWDARQKNLDFLRKTR
jgi:hypothetical protein